MKNYKKGKLYKLKCCGFPTRYLTGFPTRYLTSDPCTTSNIIIGPVPHGAVVMFLEFLTENNPGFPMGRWVRIIYQELVGWLFLEWETQENDELEEL